MKIWVGVTDEQWFDLLSRRQPDEVNFWQPSGRRRFAALDPGEPFLFKLHSPNTFIVGGGHFVRHSPLPASVAWDAFGEKNGVATYRDLLARLLPSDLHKLFDVGYLTVTPEYKLEVSPRLREEWQNGREYYAYHGDALRYMPVDAASRPDAEFLRWHNEEVFKT